MIAKDFDPISGAKSFAIMKMPRENGHSSFTRHSGRVIVVYW